MRSSKAAGLLLLLALLSASLARAVTDTPTGTPILSSPTAQADTPTSTPLPLASTPTPTKTSTPLPLAPTATPTRTFTPALLASTPTPTRTATPLPLAATATFTRTFTTLVQAATHTFTRTSTPLPLPILPTATAAATPAPPPVADMNVHPHPLRAGGTGAVSFSLAKPGQVKALLMDLRGRVLWSKTVHQGPPQASLSLDTGGLKQGIYLLKIVVDFDSGGGAILGPKAVALQGGT
jgi:hypothetical protein